MLFVLSLSLGLCVLCASALAQSDDSGAIAVELELVLAVDTSASIDDFEFRLQMDGLAKAFRDPGVISAIEAHGEMGIAVTLVQWSAEPQQVLGWSHLHDRASSELLSRSIDRVPRVAVGHTTAIGSAIRYAVQLSSRNRYAGRRRSIDVSGDGRNNSGHPIWVERNRAVAVGVTINGLAILDGDEKLESYYETFVRGGPGSFVYTAETFADYARAIRAKLLREINPAIAHESETSGDTVGLF